MSEEIEVDSYAWRNAEMRRQGAVVYRKITARGQQQEMAAPMKRVVGWINRLEWVHVYEELYSNNPSKQKHALDRIAVWKCRAPNKLSTAIECTWELTSAELHYHWAKDECSLAEQDKQLRIMYAMALTRFINLITEKGQNARYAFPVHQLANDLCLPKWMVSLRHDAVHSNLPSLTVLKAGVQTALAWLKVEYWEAQLAEEDPELNDQVHAQPEIPDSETTEMMAQMLEAYTAEYHRLYSESGCAPTNAEREQLKPILKDIEKIMASSNREVALAALLQDGFMLHTTEQLDSFGIDYKDILSNSSLRLPSDLLSLWHPILKIIRRLRAVPLLLTQLVSEDSDSHDIRIRQAMGWVLEILLSIDPTADAKPNKQLTKIFADDDAHSFTKGRRLLTSCLEHPSRYTTTILPYLFRTASPALSRVQEKLLMNTVRLYTTPSSVENTPESDDGRIYDISHLDKVEKPMDWADCPLGHCPDVPVTYTNLELPESVNSLGSSSGHVPLARPPSTPGRYKGSRPHIGKKSPKRQKDDSFEPTSRTNLEFALSELNSIKEQISLF